MTPDSELQSSLDSLLAQRAELQRLRERRLWVCAGDRQWAWQCAYGLITQWEPDLLLWLGESAPEPCRPVLQRDFRHQLGREYDLVVIDAHGGLDVDAMAAVAGTLRGGGLLVLLTPDLESWPQMRDRELERFTAAAAHADEPSRFLRRFIHCLDSEAVSLLRQSHGREKERAALCYPPRSETDDQTRYDSQAEAIEAVQALWRAEHRHRPLVLSAARGRGKSAAMGLAARHILEQSNATILVSAPRRENCEVLFRHVDVESLPGRSGHQIRFIPPDELLRNRPEADLLLIDEAAAIPLPMLMALVQAWPRVVLATTVHGYEGTGRGFELKFFPQLDRYMPDWRLLRMRAPIRWSESDPLEAWLTGAFLLDADVAASSATPLSGPGPVCHERLDRNLLAEDEGRLRALFGLLVSAHYRTRPSDLRQLLDAPALSIHVLRKCDRILAVALVVMEGVIDPARIPAIFGGQRRVRGHLIPQSLVAHVGVEAAGILRCARIMRIAVHPQLQGQGLGTRLLQCVGEYAATVGADWVGASFGATLSLLRFWKASGYVPVRLGLKREASSGAHAAVMLKAISEAGQDQLAVMHARFLELLPLQLADGLELLESDLVTELLQPAGPPRDTSVDASDITQQDWAELAAFAFARRGYEVSLVALHRWLRRFEAEVMASGVVSEWDKGYLIEKVFKHRHWSELANSYNLAGRKAAVTRLREILRALLTAVNPQEIEIERRRLSLVPELC